MTVSIPRQPPQVKLVKIMEAEKSTLRQLLELYAHDFSEFDLEDVNAHGLYGYTYLDHYWTDKTRIPLFIYAGDNLAGFVLINEFSYLENVDVKSIAEFFVMRKYRRQGIGRIVARQVFQMFPGRWEVVQHSANLPSIMFWKKVITDISDGMYSQQAIKTETWSGQALLFDNSKV